MSFLLGLLIGACFGCVIAGMCVAVRSTDALAEPTERTFTSAEVLALIPELRNRYELYSDGWNNCRFEMLSRLDAAADSEEGEV